MGTRQLSHISMVQHTLRVSLLSAAELAEQYPGLGKTTSSEPVYAGLGTRIGGANLTLSIVSAVYSCKPTKLSTQRIYMYMGC